MADAVKISLKSGAEIDVDTDTIAIENYREALAIGLKALLERKSTKIKPKGLEGEELTKCQADMLAIAQSNLAELQAGPIKKGRSSKTKSGVPQEVMAEARRMAKAIVKDLMRASKIKISTVPAKQITEAANKLIERDATIVAKATEAVAARKAVPVAEGFDINTLVHVDPALVAKANEKAAKAKASGQLSAKQAGKPKARARAASPVQG